MVSSKDASTEASMSCVGSGVVCCGEEVVVGVQSRVVSCKHARAERCPLCHAHVHVHVHTCMHNINVCNAGGDD